MGRVINKADYSFNKTAKTITFSSNYTGIELSQIQLITDVTNSTVIYQFNKSGYGGTLAGLVLTLAYNTNTAGFNNADDLMIIINESQDNTQLYSGTLSTTGSTAGLLTTDQQTISIQVSGSWEGVVFVEGSNDNSFYIPLMVYPINEFTLVDNINENGIYNLTTSTKYIRLNVQQLLTGSINTLIHGRTVDGPNAADVLSMAMDRTQRMPMIVEDINGSTGPLKKDNSNALVLSDGNIVLSVSNRPFLVNDIMAVIDTQGYQIMSWHMIAGANTNLTLQGSNDGINWIGNNLTNLCQNATPQSSINYLYPISGCVNTVICTMRYIRVICTQAATYSFVITLRNQQNPLIVPGSNQGVPVIATAPNNVNSILAGGGLSITSGYAVAGPNQPGLTTVAYPVIVGGRQAPTTATVAGTTRTMLMDSDGKVQVGLNILDQTKATNTQLTGAQLQVLTNNFQNGNSLNVTDLTQFEGQSVIELLAQILLELRISNQYHSELPQQLNAGYNNLDDPSQFRNEQSAFNI